MEPNQRFGLCSSINFANSFFDMKLTDSLTSWNDLPGLSTHLVFVSLNMLVVRILKWARVTCFLKGLKCLSPWALLFDSSRYRSHTNVDLADKCHECRIEDVVVTSHYVATGFDYPIRIVHWHPLTGACEL